MRAITIDQVEGQEGTITLKDLVARKIDTGRLKEMWEDGQYHYERLVQNLLLELRIEPRSFEGERVLSMVVIVHTTNTEEAGKEIEFIPHFRTYTHRQLVTKIHKALAYFLFDTLGERGLLTIDGWDHHAAMLRSPNQPGSKETARARDNFYRGGKFVKGEYKQFTTHLFTF